MSAENSVEKSIINNEESLQYLGWTIDISQGQFSLKFAVCKNISIREKLIKRLGEICPVKIHEIVLEPSVIRIYNTIYENVGDKQPEAVMILGLESVNDLNQLLTYMNHSRDKIIEFQNHCPFPLIIWINDDIIQKFIRLAPDIFSWGTLHLFA